MSDAPVLSSASEAGRQEGEARGVGLRSQFHGPLVHQSVRAEQAARRRGTAATKTRGTGLRRRRQALAPEGDRACARRIELALRCGQAVESCSAPSPAPTPSRSTARSSVPPCAAPSPCTPSAVRVAVLDAAAFKVPKTSDAFDLLEDWEPATADPRRARRRGVRGRALLPKPCSRGGAPPESVGVADLLGAASCSSPRRRSQAARQRAPPPPRGRGP